MEQTTFNNILEYDTTILEKHVQIISNSLEKGQSNGCFELEEAYFLKNSLNAILHVAPAIKNIQTKYKNSDRGELPLFDISKIKQLFSVIQSCSTKSQKMGALTLTDSYNLKISLDSLMNGIEILNQLQQMCTVSSDNQNNEPENIEINVETLNTEENN